MTNYWSRYMERRLTRRRGLAIGAGAFGAALLAACGGNEGASGDDAASLVVTPKDTSKEAVRGGIYRSNNDRSFSTLDPQASGTTGAGRDLGYQRPLAVKPGYLEPATPGVLEGDAGASWEWSADRTTLTMKLRPDNHFDPRPPTNGRVVEAKDVLFSLDRLQASGGRRLEWFNSLNPDSSLASWSAPDKSTVSFKLAFPDPGFEVMLPDREQLPAHHPHGVGG